MCNKNILFYRFKDLPHIRIFWSCRPIIEMFLYYEEFTELSALHIVTYLPKYSKIDF